MTKSSSDRGLTTGQLEAIDKPITTGEVKQVSVGGSAKAWYIPAGKIKRSLNDIFGVAGWDFELFECATIWTDEIKKKTKTNVGCTARARGRLTIRDRSGAVLCLKDDVGHGFAEVGIGKPPPMEGAEKGAASDCLKRCAHKVGTRFGLSLYDEDDQWGIEAHKRAQDRDDGADLDKAKSALVRFVSAKRREFGHEPRKGASTAVIVAAALDRYERETLDTIEEVQDIKSAIRRGDYDLTTGERIPEGVGR